MEWYKGIFYLGVAESELELQKKILHSVSQVQEFFRGDSNGTGSDGLVPQTYLEADNEWSIPIC